MSSTQTSIFDKETYKPKSSFTVTNSVQELEDLGLVLAIGGKVVLSSEIDKYAIRHINTGLVKILKEIIWL